MELARAILALISSLIRIAERPTVPPQPRRSRQQADPWARWTPTIAPPEAPLIALAAELVITSQYGSHAMLARKLRGGYGMANLLMNELEEHGIVGPKETNKPRTVLVAPSEAESIVMRLCEIKRDVTPQ
jgi:DNA segregation ATPase FtsK/SpoIIIE-like protein